MSYNIGQNIQYEHKLKDEIYKRGYTIQSFVVDVLEAIFKEML